MTVREHLPNIHHVSAVSFRLQYCAHIGDPLFLAPVLTLPSPTCHSISLAKPRVTQTFCCRTQEELNIGKFLATSWPRAEPKYQGGAASRCIQSGLSRRSLLERAAVKREQRAVRRNQLMAQRGLQED